MQVSHYMQHYSYFFCHFIGIHCAATLLPPVNGNVSCTSGRAIGSVCTYSCSAGNRLIDGSTTRTCSLTGTEAHWCGEAPACSGKSLTRHYRNTTYHSFCLNKMLTRNLSLKSQPSPNSRLAINRALFS